MTLRVVLATANADKVNEIVEVFSAYGAVEFVPRPKDAEEVEETGETLLENARLKATALLQATGVASMSDDTGLMIDALRGAPGVYSARYAGENASYSDNVNKVLEEFGKLGDDANRSARFVTVACIVFPDGTEISREGTIEGVIAQAPKGTQGFGYDSIFVPIQGNDRSFGEMTVLEKNQISHRGRAFRSLAEALSNANRLG